MTLLNQTRGSFTSMGRDHFLSPPLSLPPSLNHTISLFLGSAFISFFSSLLSLLYAILLPLALLLCLFHLPLADSLFSDSGKRTDGVCLIHGSSLSLFLCVRACVCVCVCFSQRACGHSDFKAETRVSPQSAASL